MATKATPDLDKWTFRLDLPGRDDGPRVVWPFPRYWPAILFAAVVLGGFSTPAWVVISMVAEKWDRYRWDSPFGWVLLLLLAAWVLVWIFPLLLGLSVLLFGRQVIRTRPGVVVIATSLPGFELRVLEYTSARMRNLRVEQTDSNLHGQVAVFDYGDGKAEFGAHVTSDQLARLQRALEQAMGVPFATGAESPAAARATPAPAAVVDAGATRIPVAASPWPGQTSLATLALVGANLLEYRENKPPFRVLTAARSGQLTAARSGQPCLIDAGV